MAAVSIAGHFVGFAGGVLFGSFIIKNDVERTGELYIRWTGISVYMYGARFSAEIYTRGCHWIPRMFA
jgi:hypothetical protein